MSLYSRLSHSTSSNLRLSMRFYNSYVRILIVILFHFVYCNQQASPLISFCRKYIQCGDIYHNLDLILPCVTVLLSSILRITLRSIFHIRRHVSSVVTLMISRNIRRANFLWKHGRELFVENYTERNRYCTFIYLHVIYPERAGRFSHCQRVFFSEARIRGHVFGLYAEWKQRSQFPNASTIVGHETLH